MKTTLKKFLNGIKKIALWIVQALAYILLVLIGIIIWVLTLVFMNPLILWILGFICPQWVVRETHEWCKNLEGLGLDLYWYSFKGVFNHLPWYARKHYVSYCIGFSHCEDEDQYRLFEDMSPQEKELNIKYLYSNVKKVVWTHHPELRKSLVLRMNMNEDLFADLLYPRVNKEVINEYMSVNTLSSAMVWQMIYCLDNSLAYRETPLSLQSDQSYLLNKIISSIETNGANGLIDKISSCHSPFVVDHLYRALDVYCHREIVTKTREDLENWQIHCMSLVKNNQKLPTKAQILMNQAQYDVYAEKGLKLSAEAIEHFIRKGDRKFFTSMCEREEFPDEERLTALLNSKPELWQIYEAAQLSKDVK